MSNQIKELYPSVNTKILKALSLLTKFPNINFSLGLFKDIEILPVHRECVEKALEVLEDICQNCSCDHKIWTLAGGFVTYKLGNTNTFNDIDIFVSCNGTRSVNMLQSQDWAWYNDRNVATFWYKSIKTQIIQVNFDLPLKHTSIRAFVDLFSVYVLKNFDLPLCKATMSYNVSNFSKAYIIDLTAVETNKKANAERAEKYAARKVQGILKTLPTLAILAAQAVFDLK